MRFILMIILISSFRIPKALSVSLMDLSPDEWLKVAEDFAKTLNEKIFNARHQSFPVENLSKKGAKAWKPDEIMGTDTVAVRIDRNGHVYVAGNVETRTTRYNKDARQLEGTDFGFTPKDHVIIREEMLKNSILRNQPLHIVGLDKKATDTFDNRKAHAEVQLLHDRQHNPPTPNLQNNNKRRISVIGASKAACKYCTPQLTSTRIIHNPHGVKKVTNWQIPQDIGSVNRATYYPPNQHFQPKLIGQSGFETSRDVFSGQVAGTSYNPGHVVLDPNAKRITYPGFETTNDLFSGQIAGQKYVSNSGFLYNGRSTVLASSPGIPNHRHSLSGPSTGLEPLPYTKVSMPARVFPVSVPKSQYNTEKGKLKSTITHPGDQRWTSTTLSGSLPPSTISAPNLFGINSVNPLTSVTHIVTAPVPVSLPAINSGSLLSSKTSILPNKG